METKHTDKNVYIEVIRTENMIVNSLMKMWHHHLDDDEWHSSEWWSLGHAN
jgi:hypothetical protein